LIMFSQNSTMIKTEAGYRINLSKSAELDRLYEKYGQTVLVKITAPATPGTEQQNRAAHALLTEYYRTGMHSAPDGTTLAEFKTQMKCQYGPVSTVEYKGSVYMVPKSWSEYSKAERMIFLDGLISEIHQSGANVDPRIQEILAGMEEIKEQP
jgi:hypothetical protein